MGGRLVVDRVEGSHLWEIRSTYYSPGLVEHAKAVPGMVYNSPTKSWRGYVDAVRAVVARLEHMGLRVFDADTLPDDEAWRRARTPFLFATSGAKGLHLRDYQVEGVRFLIQRSGEGALLADAMRTGKSAVATVTARAFKQHTLVICQPHVVGVWGRPPDAIEGPGQIALWWPDVWRPKAPGSQVPVRCLETVKPFKHAEVLRKLSRTDDSNLSPDDLEAKLEAGEALGRYVNELDEVQVIICHYDIAYAWADVLIAWGIGTLIFDEVHICAGYQSRRAKALKTLRARANRTIALTGTPITNRPKHAHNVLDLVCPGRFGLFFIPPNPLSEKKPMASYARLFCGSYEETIGVGEFAKTVWKHDRESNLDEPDMQYALTPAETLRARLRFMMLRRLKRDVDPQLPEKVREIVDIAVRARSTISLTTNLFGKGAALQLRRHLDLTADAKFKPVVEIVKNHLEEREKVLCFCYRRFFAESIATAVNAKAPDDTLVVFVHGGLTAKERDKRIYQLRVHDGPGVLACTIDTTATGLDLSFASVAVFAELTWEPHELAQAEERLYKFGTGNKALVQYVIARGTGDELILRSVINKLDTFERVIGATGDAMKTELGARKSKEDPMKRLYNALIEMQAAAPPKMKRRKVKAQ